MEAFIKVTEDIRQPESDQEFLELEAGKLATLQ
jgi:hypothetical protein